MTRTLADQTIFTKMGPAVWAQDWVTCRATPRVSELVTSPEPRGKVRLEGERKSPRSGPEEAAGPLEPGESAAAGGGERLRAVRAPRP